MSDESDRVVRFPQSRLPGRSKNRDVKNLGMTALARAVDPAGRGTRGHWCKRCQGVWYGQAGEVECPVCGNRHG